MNIAIKSEIDSRVLVYPLIRSLRSYGSILVISNNQSMKRLIESEEDGGFRNIRVIVDASGATDTILREYGITEGDFDCVIYDNVGVKSYHLMIILLGLAQSESFDEDIKNIREESNVKLIQFGRPVRKETTPADRNNKKQIKPEEYDPTLKFSEQSLTKEELRKQQEILRVIPFPTYTQIEEVEALHKFYAVDDMLAGVFYDMLKGYVSVSKQNFIKEVRRKDESSGYIQHGKTRRS